MKKDEQFFTEAFKTLDTVSGPTEAQKERMLQSVLAQARQASDGQPATSALRLKDFVANYPWRFAFGVAAVQSSLCTLIFGSSYTHFIMSILGG